MAHCPDFLRLLMLCKPPKITVFMAQDRNRRTSQSWRKLSTVLSKQLQKQQLAVELCIVLYELAAMDQTKMSNDHTHVDYRMLAGIKVKVNGRWKRSVISVGKMCQKTGVKFTDFTTGDEFTNCMKTQLHTTLWENQSKTFSL